MPLDANFYRAVEPLFVPGMGTENVGPLLYSITRMTRPRNVLEVGLGYTTPFIVQALSDSLEEFNADKLMLGDIANSKQRASVLSSQYYSEEFDPHLFAIDDHSTAGTSAPKVLDVLLALGLADLLDLHKGDFRGCSDTLPNDRLPLDLVWFDCGGLPEYIDFIREYWPLINPDHGMLILHFTYWPFIVEKEGKLRPKSNNGPTPNEVRMMSSSVLNEFKRQQIDGGMDAHFEVLSLLEPHKEKQGSVTMIRKVAPNSMCRSSDFQQEVLTIFGEKPDPFTKL